MIRFTVLLALLFAGVPAVAQAPAQAFVVNLRGYHPVTHHRVMIHPKRPIAKPLTVKQIIEKALTITNHPHTWTRPLLWMAWQESKFHANAVDGKWVRLADYQGDTEHAEGLMQVLPTTFAAHALHGYKNIWNPLDNVVASIRYIVGRYGTPYRIPGVMNESNYGGY